jgi:hypothetical protein
VIDVAKHISDAPADMIDLINKWSVFEAKFKELAATGKSDIAL